MHLDRDLRSSEAKGRSFASGFMTINKIEAQLLVSMSNLSLLYLTLVAAAVQTKQMQKVMTLDFEACKN